MPGILGSSGRWRRARAALLVMVAVLSWWIGRGLVSSNDGSHLALGRALALRGETRIDPEESLTLWIDRAHRDGHVYADRPPGTAFAALPSIWLGDRLDPLLKQASVRRGAIVYMPATQRYVETYGTRRERHGGAGPALVDLQGTALMLTAQAALVGMLGLWAMLAWLRVREVDAHGQAFALAALAFGTLWGPYSTALFSHVTAGTATMLMLLALELARRRRDAGDPRGPWLDAAAGLAGGWAIATDYALVLAVVPLVVLGSAPRRWPPVLAGALPIALATALYHQAAFGSPWSIGYDHHAAFAFARERGSTFSGNFVEGLWTSWGLGRGAGVLAQSPIVLVGTLGLMAGTHRRLLLAFSPWLVALALHQTPWGGDTNDHRYLVPMLPVVGLGLASVWAHASQRNERGLRIALFSGLVLVTLVSALLAWTHFFAWRGF